MDERWWVFRSREGHTIIRYGTLLEAMRHTRYLNSYLIDDAPWTAKIAIVSKDHKPGSLDGFRIFEVYYQQRGL